MSARRLSYTTDLTDEEWQILAPLLPPEKSGGRPRKHPIREVLNGIQYILRGGCASSDKNDGAANKQAMELHGLVISRNL